MAKRWKVIAPAIQKGPWHLSEPLKFKIAPKYYIIHYYSSQLLKWIKNFYQDISNTSRYFSKIWILSVDMMSLQGLCWILSCFTDFEGHQTSLIDTRWKMTCHRLWVSSKTCYSEMWILGNKNERMRELHKILHQKMPNRQNWDQQWGE